MLRRIKIRRRLFFAFIVLPLSLMILFFCMYYSFSVNMIVSKNKQTSQMAVSMTEEIFHLNITKLEDQMMNLGQEDYVSQLLKQPEDEAIQLQFKERLHQSEYVKDRSGLQLYDASGKVIYEDGSLYKINLRNYKDKVQKTKQTVSWTYVQEENAILLMNEIIVNEQVVGYMVSDFREEAFSASFAGANHTNNVLVVVDENDQYLFGHAAFTEGTYIDTRMEQVNVEQVSYYLSAKKIQGMQWKIANLVNADYILEEIHNFRNMLLMYGLAFLVLLAIVATLIYHSIYDPIHNILKSMRALDQEHITNNRVDDRGNDELHELSTNFNDLLNRVQELVNTVEMEQEQKRETQFQLLQAQINPHFLFNTLNTLNCLAIMNEDKPVSEGISALAKLLRNTIVDSKEVVSVQEELENLKNYIIIQKLRFGDLFETVYNVDSDVKNCQILKFLLQPIVENSILHAFEEDKEHQVLTIRIKRMGMYLRIEIGDNGKGFHTIDKEVGDKKLSSIGIVNIQERIQLMYGGRYSMEITSAVNKGTIVTLLLPLVKGG